MQNTKNNNQDSSALLNTEFNSLKVETNKGVAFVTFHHGEINVLDMVSVMELVQLAQFLEEDSNIKVIVFQSSNPDYFLSHADFKLLQEFRDQGAYDSDEMPLYSGLLEKFRTMPKATIAKIQGRARGGGAEFAMAMDMSFGEIGKAFLSQMEVIIGILPGGGSAQYLARKIGRSRAMEICLGGGDFSAVEAEKYGYINRALSSTEIDSFVDELAYRIASYPAQAIALNKAAVNLFEEGRSNEFITSNAWFAELVKAPDFDKRVEHFFAQGGQTRNGEMENWSEWAPKLTDKN
ncbi:enoyl-CoA hydratase/isomerase family protein [Flagellimonas meridianipacifica]|uniref:Enoyl-CoA hydratase/carnithine racemase n=1 Tax=Flagellimonas meridianipacifica TaxID=1080225 RepID=A0A2T0MIK4_9FLAO|nr:enoyl-CoA hydratase/isomerase family protein [Allomuricauda pacifica]PRX57417.1 enoyl-CoA hydratase/carnithine racemase [Allomuricauda pacifica]